MDIVLLWLFLFLALAIGWCLGFFARKRRKKDAAPAQIRSSSNYKHRLQMLFDSYSDDSIDQFVQSLEVNADTLPIHISIGKHFRRQGEVEKAILIHQNLMAHPSLDDIQSEPVVYELAKDYKAAGLFDRAESLLLQLGDSKSFGIQSKKLLLEVYEHEKDWSKAIAAGELVDFKKSPETALRVSYYLCELAGEQVDDGELNEARRTLKKALSTSKSCVRAHMGLARLDMAQAEYKLAISHLKQALSFAPDFAQLVLPLLEEITVKTQSFEPYQAFLEKLYERTGQIPIMMALVESFRLAGKNDEYIQKLASFLSDSPNLIAAGAYLECLQRGESVSGADVKTIISLELLESFNQLVNDLLVEKSAYQCSQCGFSGQQHYWLCPSCKNWQTTVPVVEFKNKVVR